jgi:hypothetical protein
MEVFDGNEKTKTKKPSSLSQVFDRFLVTFSSEGEARMGQYMTGGT